MAMVQKKNVEDLNVSGKRVIVRVDFNVPLDKKTGEITDDKRIKGALPTIKYLVDNNAKVILVSHLGRPKNGPEPAFSMKPAAERLAELLGKPVTLAADVIGEEEDDVGLGWLLGGGTAGKGGERPDSCGQWMDSLHGSVRVIPGKCTLFPRQKQRDRPEKRTGPGQPAAGIPP